MNTLQAVLDTIENANLPEGTYLDLCNKLKTLSDQLKPEPEKRAVVVRNSFNTLDENYRPPVIRFLKHYEYFPNDDIDTFYNQLNITQLNLLSGMYNNTVKDYNNIPTLFAEWLKHS
jgi:hypothetical protein